MTVCTYWEDGDCWHGSDCWNDHFHSSGEQRLSEHYASLKGASSRVAPLSTAPTTSTASASASSKPTSATPASSSALDLAIAKLPKLPSISVKATTSPLLFGSVYTARAMSVPSQCPESPESAADTSATVAATDPPEVSSQELKVKEDVESNVDEAVMLKKIAKLEETVRMLEASADPERQSFKNDLLREELNAASERNRELQIDFTALNTQEAKLRVQISDSETKVDSLEKTNAALSKDLDRERKESHANRTKNEVYLKALQEMNAISTKATATCSRTSSSPAKPPFSLAFGSTSGLGASSAFSASKRPSIGFGFGYIPPPINSSTPDNGPGQPSLGLPPSSTSASTLMATCEVQPDLKRKIEETEGGEGDHIQRNAEATTGSKDGKSKRARTATDEERDDSDSV